MSATDSTLDQSARRAVRVLAVSHLDQARGSTRRLPSADKLHDFRVALRRLRTLIRVYRDVFGGAVDRKSRRRLRALGRKSNRRRDAQVQLAHLLALTRVSANRAAARVGERLQEQIANSKDVPATLRKDYRQLDRKLRRRLSRKWESSENGRPDLRFREVAVAASRRLANALGDALDQIGSAADVQALHSARLAAKRLRYTLEPLQPASAPVSKAVACLVQLQDLLGDARDTGILRETVLVVRDHAGEALAREFDTLISRLQAQADLRFAEVRTHWLDGNGQEFFQDLHRALDAISQPATHS